MATIRFLPQATLDVWVDQGRADLRAERVVDLATKAEFPVREALRFARLESGTDSQGLLNKVKSLEQVKALGGEHYLTSVILGEAVYEVVQGWLAEETEAGSISGPGGSRKKVEGTSPEADMLARLLLDKLS